MSPSPNPDDLPFDPPQPTGGLVGEPITIQLNGEPRPLPAGLDLEAALIHLGHQPRLVVVEYNGVIVPRASWPQHIVRESDTLEVVTIVGGGS